MTRARILAAEDEAVIAMDLRQRLAGLGYEVAGIVGTGEEAVARAATLRPDLVLMDIRLRGQLDGVAAAEEIRRRLDLPVVFVTAHSDAATLARAKVTEPFGYLLKPYEDRELETTIEIALYKHGADAKLRRVERWMASALRSLGDAVIATDLAGRITYLSPAAEQLTRWTHQEAAGRPFGEVFKVRHPATGPVEDPIARVLEEGLVVGLAPGTLLATRDGREVPIDDSAAPLRDERGEVSGVVVCFRDASLQAATAEELRRTQAELRQSQKLEALGRMSGGIAHDFNNLLTAIGGFTELVLERLPPGPERSRLDEVVSATRRAAGLTGQLLAFSRKQPLSPQVLEPNAVVADMEGLLRRLLGEDVALRVDLRAAWRVRADRSQLEQVVMNLAVNARDAMPAGGRLTIETSDVELDAAYVAAHPEAAAGPHVRLAVTDTGLGMDPDTLARAFEPFFTTKGHVGTGLGLATVYGIVRQSGGHVLAQSAPGRGSTFEAYLPRTLEALAPAPLPPDGAAGGGTETVLVVEDEPSVRGLQRRILEAAGYRVLEAGSGPEALARAGTAPIDLLVTDVVMPGMTGLALAEELLRTHPGLAVLCLSGYAGAALERHGALPPRSVFLAKPFTPAALKQAVRQALGRRRAAR